MACRLGDGSLAIGRHLHSYAVTAKALELLGEANYSTGISIPPDGSWKSWRTWNGAQETRIPDAAGIPHSEIRGPATSQNRVSSTTQSAVTSDPAVTFHTSRAPTGTGT